MKKLARQVAMPLAAVALGLLLAPATASADSASVQRARYRRPADRDDHLGDLDHLHGHRPVRVLPPAAPGWCPKPRVA